MEESVCAFSFDKVQRPVGDSDRSFADVDSARICLSKGLRLDSCESSASFQEDFAGAELGSMVAISVMGLRALCESHLLYCCV